MLLAKLKNVNGVYTLRDINRNITIVSTDKDNISDAIEAINQTLDDDLQIINVTSTLYEIATIYGRVRKGLISIWHNNKGE